MLSIKYVLTDLNTIVNNLKVPVGNLSISRSQMPQIDNQEKFKKSLTKMGIEWAEDEEQVGKLRLTQSEINKTKIMKMMSQIRKRGIKAFDPIIISDDGYVIDGSHRFAAKLNQSKRAKMPVIKVKMKALELLNTIASNPDKFNVSYRNLSDSKISKPTK